MDVDSRGIPQAELVALSQHPEVIKAMRQQASAIARDARQLAPVDSGQLKGKGIGIELIEDDATGLMHYGVGWTRAGWYGWLVEAGTEDTTPRPHLVPAAIKHGAGGAG
ncbi:HK97-gp10 family putative phage morphogenesis protein [Micromonospora arborensis]|uniref:HK97-gp10 family putative phage morphogenesis protein n=1 Tax=Micromonospora arborensis TaxID=2116518 RepID=UPI00340D0719